MKISMRRLVILLPVLFYCAGSNRPSIVKQTEPSQELRAIYVTRFDWVRKDPQEMKARITAIIEDARQSGFNALFFQVRGQAETLYPSAIEPWSEMLPGGNPGFDPLQLAIEKAHQAGLQFHAYVNLLPMWNRKEPPQNRQHLFYRHGPLVSAESSWVCFGSNAKPMALNEYYYLNPALAQVKSYLKQVVGRLVGSYDLDGLHFDRIRYPGPDYLHDPYSEKQFISDSLQQSIQRPEWARAKLTALVEAVVAEALLIKPYLQISCAAWGLYKTRDLTGYEKFSSGYDAYYQDSLLWLERGIMDFIVPMIYWDMKEPKPNLNEVWLDFKRRTPLYRNIVPGLIVKSQWLESGELAGQIDFLRRSGAAGHVLFSYSGMERKNPAEKFFATMYQSQPKRPAFLDRHNNRIALALQTTEPLRQSGSPLRLSIFSPNSNYALSQTMDLEGWCNYILAGRFDSLQIAQSAFTLAEQKPPFRFLINPDKTLHHVSPWLEFRDYPTDTTTQTSFHLLAKTDPANRAFIENDSCHVYQTGVYFSKLQFKQGMNRYTSRIITVDSTSAVYGRQVFVKPPAPARPALPLWIDSTSVEPQVDQWLTPHDRLRIRFNGSKEQEAWVAVQPGKKKILLSRNDRSDYSTYEGDLALSELAPGQTYRVSLVLQSPDKKNRSVLTRPVKSLIKIDEPIALPLLRVKKDKAALSYNLGPIRLGGPIMAEYPVGVILQCSGRIGRFYRIRLNAVEEGFIAAEEVEPLDASALTPSFYITSLNATPFADYDLVSIPYIQPIPYAIFPEPELSRIRLVLYGAKTSSTWITHRNGLRVVDRLDWRQTTPETYEVLVYLQTKKNWGYTLNHRSNSLELQLSYPPALTIIADSVQIKGLVVAIEAGHGGSNTGAMGLSGMEEKSLNLDVALRLEKLCQERGIKVIQVRAKDCDMSLEAKRSAIEGSDADLAVSIHANAGGTSNGYLGASGVSTYYHNPFWADFAEISYRRLLQLPLKEFGTVGSFNYRVIRSSSRPTILVEQAFMSNAVDEEKLFDPIFRQQMAEKILQGILDYVSYMFDRPTH